MRIGLGLSIVGQQVAPSLTGYLLEDYSGAAAAYSVRLLDRAYTGSAIRVRESSGGTEADIGFDGENLDETALLAHCGANDGFVTKWYDQSGYGYDAIQATAGSQPKIVSAGTVVKENGRPALDYDGVDDRLSGSNIINGSGDRYISVVYKPSSLASGNSIFDLTSTNTGTGNAYTLTPEVALRCRLVTHVTTVGTLNQSLLSVNQSGSQIESDVSLYYNGTLAPRESGGDGTINTDNSNFNISYGQTLYGDNLIQEIIIYASDQSANRTGIEANINNYFSIYP